MRTTLITGPGCALRKLFSVTRFDGQLHCCSSEEIEVPEEPPAMARWAAACTWVAALT